MPRLGELLGTTKGRSLPAQPNVLGALLDPQFYKDAGGRLADAFTGGVKDLLPRGAGPIAARNLGVPEDPSYRPKMENLANFALTFIGPRAKTWNLDTNAAARQMNAQHAKPADIWRKTGNMLMPDNKWRQEISDAGSRFVDPGFNEGATGAFLQHPELFKAYPEIARYPLQRGQGPGGAFNPNTKQLMVGGEPRSTALHETQHGVQEIEGFARGGNLDEFWDQSVRTLQAQYPRVDVATHPDLAKLARILQDNYYKRLIGEAESRAVEARRNLTPEERLQYYPGDIGSQYGFDVPLSEMIRR